MRFVKIFLFVLCALGVPVLFSDSADALAQTEPQGGQMFAVGGVGDQFNTRTSVSRLYVPTSVGNGSVNVFVVNAWNNFAINVHTVIDSPTANNSCDLSTAARTGTQSITDHPSGSKTVSITNINASTRIEDDTVPSYKIYCIVTTTTASAVIRFNISAGASQLIGNDVSTNNGTTGYVGSNNPVAGGANWSKSLDFAPPCDLGDNSSRAVTYYDLDLSSSFQQPINPMVSNVQHTTINGGYGTLSQVPGSPQSYTAGGENQIKSHSFTANLNGGPRKYRLSLGPIASNNAIKVALPFDQIYTITTCAETLNASCSFVSAPATANVGQNFTIQVRVNNLSSSTGNISGSTNTVTTTRQSGPTVSGLPNTNNVYGATGPGASRNLTALSVTANSAGTLVIRAAIANTDNNASCTRNVTIENVTNASCGFINTPATATVGIGFTVQVRVTNASGSTANISGSSHPVNTARVSGPSVSGLPSNNNSYAATAPGNSRNLPSITVTPNGTGTLVVRATMANTDNNASCSINITVSFAPPEVHCEIEDPGFIQIGQTGVPLVVNAWFTDASGAATSANTGNIVGAIATVGGTAAAPSTGMPINGVAKGVTATPINFTFSAPPGPSDVDAIVTMSFPNTSGGNVNGDCETTIIVGNMPYMKVYGGDIHAGGQFINVDPSCDVPPNHGGVYGFAEQVSGNDYRGASAQLTISSLLAVNEFYSVSQRSPTGNTRAPKGLTIANTGGEYGGDSTWEKCIFNFYDGTKANSDVVAVAGTPPSSIPANQGLIRYETSSITLSGLDVAAGSQVAIYVDGNVYIEGNITVGSNRSAVANIAELPYLAIIARGNIYVANNVTRIDGLYIAQPENDGSEGKFYTCTDPSTNTPYTALNLLYANCRTPLRINGSIVARQIRFARSNGTLNSAAAREYPNVSNESGFDNIAETFVYTPEMWMAPSPLSIPNASNLTPETIKWQAATSLPPVF